MAARSSSAALGGGLVLTVVDGGGFPAACELEAAGAVDAGGAGEVCASKPEGTPLRHTKRSAKTQTQGAGRRESSQRTSRVAGLHDGVILHIDRRKQRFETGVPGKARCARRAHMETLAGDSVTY
jgi:hypothetical protein